MGKKKITKNSNGKNFETKEKDLANKNPITAQDISKAMAANMAANQADPDFIKKYEAQNLESAKYALNKNAKQLADAGVQIPGFTEASKDKDKNKNKKN